MNNLTKDEKMKKQINKKILLMGLVLTIILISIVSVSAVYFSNTIFTKLVRSGGSPSSDSIETTFD